MVFRWTVPAPDEIKQPRQLIEVVWAEEYDKLLRENERLQREVNAFLAKRNEQQFWPQSDTGYLSQPGPARLAWNDDPSNLALNHQQPAYGNAVASFDWRCSYCGTPFDGQHAPDCARNSVENQELARLLGQRR